MKGHAYQAGAGRAILRNLCFLVFGLTVFFNPFDRFNPVNAGLGIVFCLLLGWLYRRFLRGLLGLVNRDLKEQFGKEAVHTAVDNAMLFLIPFAVAVLMATYGLGWTMAGPFLSTGIMVVATTAALEIGRLKGKPALRNTAVATGTAFAFVAVLTQSLPLISRAPGLVEGLVRLVPSLLSGGGPL